MLSIVTVQFRFYGELNDFLPPPRKRQSFVYTVKGHPSVKDTVEALGVPHPEIGYLFVNGKPVDFAYQLQGEDKVVAYPINHLLKNKKLKCLRPPLPKIPQFVLDSHLGKLARHLRLLGFDTIYKKIFPDPEIIRTAEKEKRIILTRDVGLLKNKRVQWGRWIRAVDPDQQLKEVLNTFQLRSKIKPFKRCLECNGIIVHVAKTRIAKQLSSDTRKYFDRFYQCRSCRRIYWQGSHYEKLIRFVFKVTSNLVLT